MRQKLFTIDDVFNITERGIIVTGELEFSSGVFRIGSLAALVQPDGREIVTEISGIEHVKPIDNENFNWNRVGVMFKNITKEDVPIGTEVLLQTNE